MTLSKCHVNSLLPGDFERLVRLGPRRKVGSQVDASGKQRPTMADVAEKAGVSRALVSIIFRNQPGASEETRQRVLRVADEIGYRPDSAARLLARGRSRTLGVMFTVHQTFHTDLIEGIYPEAERLGYEVLLSARHPGRSEAKAWRRCSATVVRR
jgi:DNA-binding LacI/PurR family transcriptional regulator